MNSPSLIDLHTHSHCSDGVLSPIDLVARAAARGVGLLALTDHDTVAGCAEARAACDAAGIRFVAGIEVSTSWRGRAIHVIGLDVDARSEALTRLIESIATRRRERVHAICERLAARGRIAGRDIAAQVAATAGLPTRMHLARALVAMGHATDSQQAFDRWLNPGRPGHVPVEWPALTTVLPHLAGACRALALAHPHRYKLSGGALRQLVADFAAGGGAALEVDMAGMAPHDQDRIASLARHHGLAGSAGSDFHDPAVPWNPPGRFAKLPSGIAPIAERLADA
ncbi:MAG: 5'-3' exoribonuclease [Steroidobacteraceae bacterium]|nr:5'-3' exoribonuclease [Steroidobacteraceae bacterium]